MALKTILRRLALRHGMAERLYRRLCRPSGREWAAYLRERGGIYHIGRDCSILSTVSIVDPELTWIGDRCCLGTCTLICHDGSIEMIEQRYGIKIDRIGPIILEDDVYIGEGVMIVAGNGVRIGEGSLIGAGAVVRQNIPAGSLVVGNPAKVVGKVEDLLRFWEADMLALPWADLIASRKGAFDPALQGELTRQRQQAFFGGMERSA